MFKTFRVVILQLQCALILQSWSRPLYKITRHKRSIHSCFGCTNDLRVLLIDDKTNLWKRAYIATLVAETNFSFQTEIGKKERQHNDNINARANEFVFILTYRYLAPNAYPLDRVCHTQHICMVISYIHVYWIYNQ